MAICINCKSHMTSAHNSHSCLNCGRIVVNDPNNNVIMDTILDQASIALTMMGEDARATEQIELLKELCAEDKLTNMEGTMHSLVSAIFMAGVRKGHS